MGDERAVLILGAAGFIGRALTVRLASRGAKVIAAVRGPQAIASGIETRVTGTLTATTDWGPLLAGTRSVVHLASRAHAPVEGETWIAAEAETAASLARAARREGIERIVLMSSIKVHGNDSGAGRIRASDPPAPADAYGKAKLGIEVAMAGEGGALVVLRPPLVYGPGVGANFRALLGLVDRGLPLPLAAVANRRSLAFLDNLIDLVELALTHDRAPGGRFLLRDDDEVSTPDLIRLIARSLNRPARLFPCPLGLLRLAARLAGEGDAADRLLGSLSVDDEATRATLGWRPRFALADGIAATCRWYRARVGSAPARPL